MQEYTGWDMIQKQPLFDESKVLCSSLCLSMMVFQSYLSMQTYQKFKQRLKTMEQYFGFLKVEDSLILQKNGIEKFHISLLHL